MTPSIEKIADPGPPAQEGDDEDKPGETPYSIVQQQEEEEKLNVSLQSVSYSQPGSSEIINGKPLGVKTYIPFRLMAPIMVKDINVSVFILNCT